MAGRLYLDTARVGLMSPTAQRIHIDFARFAGEEAASLYFDDFLLRGADAWPARLRKRYSALHAWKGASHLKAELKRLAGAPADATVLVANRSAQLMKLAAELLSRLCRNVFVTDLCWPSYLRTLRHRVRRSAGRITRIPVCCSILSGGMNAAEIAELLANLFVKNNCDGLFLPAVDNLGIRLPIRQIVSNIQARTEIRFTVIDGAQEYCQLPVQEELNHCDFYLTGSHKWLRAYHPLGIGFYGRPLSAPHVEQVYLSMLANCTLDDPLLRYLRKLEQGRQTRYGETVSVAALFSCQGAVHDALINQRHQRHAFTELHNSKTLFELADATGWKPFALDNSLSSRIKLLKAPHQQLTSTSAPQLRQRFHEIGIAITAYQDGLVRFSLPDTPWTENQTELLYRALRDCRPKPDRRRAANLAADCRKRISA